MIRKCYQYNLTKIEKANDLTWDEFLPSMDKLYAISSYNLIPPKPQVYTFSLESVYRTVFEKLQKIRLNELRRNMLRQSRDSREHKIIGI